MSIQRFNHLWETLGHGQRPRLSNWQNEALKPEPEDSKLPEALAADLAREVCEKQWRLLTTIPKMLSNASVNLKKSVKSRSRGVNIRWINTKCGRRSHRPIFSPYLF